MRYFRQTTSSSPDFVGPPAMITRVSALFVNTFSRWDAMDHDLHTKRIRRAAQSLEGLSCGDAFGERFFLPSAVAESMIQQRTVPAPPWFFTDDTVMALSILETLAEYQEINPDSLAISFAGRYDASRGYGPAMHQLLPTIRRQPQSWRTEAAALFRAKVRSETARPCALLHWVHILLTIPRELPSKPASRQSRPTLTRKPSLALSLPLLPWPQD